MLHLLCCLSVLMIGPSLSITSRKGIVSIGCGFFLSAMVFLDGMMTGRLCLPQTGTPFLSRR